MLQMWGHFILSSFKNLYNEKSVSTDYVLFGNKKELEEVWKDILNCSEADKLFVLLKLLVYFTDVKEGFFPLKKEKSRAEQELLQLMHRLQNGGKIS